MLSLFAHSLGPHITARETQPSLEHQDLYRFYRYTPSLAGAAIFVVLFAVSTFVHAWQTWRKRSWFLIPFIIGGLFDFIGCIGRILSSKDPTDRDAFIMQTLLLLLAPALFAASIYMILGRIILLTDGEKFSIIRRTWLTKIFVGGDVLSFAMQGAGGGIMSGADSDPKKIKTGENIIIAGLFVQLFFFGLFVVTSAVFQWRGRYHLNQLPSHIVWQKHFYVLYLTSSLILVRSIFRIAEYIQGKEGYLLRHEVYLYIFEAALMLIVMVTMNVVHPGDIAIMIKEKYAITESVELTRSDYLKGKDESRDTDSQPTRDIGYSNNA